METSFALAHFPELVAHNPDGTLTADEGRPAATRFEEATKWNSGEAEAWLRLGEAREKLRDTKAAHEAFAKYLELAGDSKVAGEIRKKLEKHK